MAIDPRTNLVDKCPPTAVQPADNKRKFFQNVGKVGDLAVLNHVNNDIGKGLRTLRGISENVRNNSGPVPNIIRQAGEAVLDTGADFVLDTLNLNSRQTRGQATIFSPDVANRALGQAESIYDSVRNGQFDEFEDLPTAIAEFSNLEILLKSIFTAAPRAESKFKELCVSSYAKDLIELAPKHKFMFVVEFIFNDPYSTGSFDENRPNKELEFAFVIKRSTRPQIAFDYEDINMYNFRTRVLKRMEYQPMSMVFYDDIQDRTLEFYENYLKAVSPVSRIDLSTGAGQTLEERGMDFGEATGTDQDQFSASISTLNRGLGTELTPKTVIQQINIFHLVQGGRKVDKYSFANPRITELQLDDLDMTDSGEGNEVSLAFNYDSVFIETGIDIATLTTTLTELTNLGQFPIEPNLSAGTTTEPPDPGSPLAPTAPSAPSPSLAAAAAIADANG